MDRLEDSSFSTLVKTNEAKYTSLTLPRLPDCRVFNAFKILNTKASVVHCQSIDKLIP